VDIEPFTYLASGNTRDVFEAQNKSWVLKLELPRGKPLVYKTKNEWDIYQNCQNDFLRKILPKCYGYGELDRDGQLIAVLLTERVQIRFDEAVHRLRTCQISEVHTTLVAEMHMIAVREMLLTAVKGLYLLPDWDMQDIAFDYVEGTGTLSMKLLSWSGYLKSPFEEPRARMATAMKALLKGLPGLQRSRHAITGEEWFLFPKQEDLWNSYLQQCLENISQWWSALNFPTQDFELKELGENLERVGFELTAATSLSSTPGSSQNGSSQNRS
jgi:hypothetical protein